MYKKWHDKHPPEIYTKIVEELIAVQGNAVDTGGYYKTDDSRTEASMRPSETLNSILATI